MTAKRLSTVICLPLAGLLSGADFPQAQIANRQIRAKLYLPEGKSGFYRGTRFDWSGVVASLVYRGHDFYGPWFDRTDPNVHDFVYQGQEIVAGPCSAIVGPVEEFQPLGYNEAAAGGTFVKVGVGALRKSDSAYDHYKLYEIAEPGKWTVSARPDSVEFTHELADPASGYGYVYRKTVRLSKDAPLMILDHALKNTGRNAIRTSVYNHNFLILDRLPPGPDFALVFRFPIQTPRPPSRDLAEIRGNRIAYLKQLRDRDVVQTRVLGFGQSSEDHDIRIENARLGVGVRITGDRPLSNASLWSIRTVLSIEPFVAVAAESGAEFTWRTSYEYYALGK